MAIPQLKASNRMTVFIGVSLLLQLTVVAAGSLIKFSLPSNTVEMPKVGMAPTRYQPGETVVVASESEVEVEVEEDALKSDLTEEASLSGNTPRVVVHRVKPGETLTSIWESHGAASNGGMLAAQAFKAVNVPVSSIKKGEDLDLQITPEGDITGLKKKLSDGKVLLLDGSSLKGYKATVVNPDLQKKERVVSGTISRSFASSAHKVNLPKNVVDALVDLFSSRVEFRKDLQPGDAFAVVYDENTTPDGQFISAGPIKAASIEKAGQTLYAVRHEGKSGKAFYYDNKGQPLGDSFLRYPLKFSFISSAFSYGRFHPILKKVLPHNGIDFAAPAGTPVRSVADGVVASAGYNFGGGNTIKIKHGDRYSTVYLHLSRIADGLRQGTRIARGQVIGAVGSTGISTGPHLHFGFFDRERYINPLTSSLPSNIGNAEPIPSSYLMAKINQLNASQDSVKLAAAQRTETDKAS